MEPAARLCRNFIGEGEDMWELGFDVVEKARAARHGRAQVRREERVHCDVPVTVFREEGRPASGWCLDRSATGARVILNAASTYGIDEHVRLHVDGESLAFRVVWAYAEESACILGLERIVAVSGEYPCLASASVEDTLVTRAA